MSEPDDLAREGRERAPQQGLQHPPGEPPEPPEEGDFAEEHTSPTVADQQAGGPEGEKEAESPTGYAGQES